MKFEVYMPCIFCGKTIEYNAKYCQYCGKEQLIPTTDPRIDDMFIKLEAGIRRLGYAENVDWKVTEYERLKELSSVLVEKVAIAFNYIREKERGLI